MEVDDKTRLELYTNVREELMQRQLSNSESADKTIITISSAALGLSFTFLKDFLLPHKPVFLCVLYSSWILFVLAILITVIGFFVSQKALDEQLKMAENYYIHKNPDAFVERPKYKVLTDWFNYIAAAMFVFGVISTCVFVYTNYEKGVDMTEKKNLNESAIATPLTKIPVPDNQKAATVPVIPKIPVQPVNNQQQSVPSGKVDGK